MEIIVHTDGGSRGNPGPAAIGVVIEEKNGDGSMRVLEAFGKVIGETTNNVAEYTAVIEALRALLRITEQGVRVDAIHFYLDSLLVVSQVNGVYRIKQPHLRNFLFEIRALEKEVGVQITYEAVRREYNTHADQMVNQALDHASGH